jgi:hypothetical protein
MSMSRSHIKKTKLRKKLRTFTGEDLGTALIDYLERTDRPADDPVETLVDLHERLRSGEDTRDEIVDLINQSVRNRPEFCTVPNASRTPEGTVKVEDVPALSGPVHPVIARQMLEWNRAVVLLKRGMFDRIRRCAKQDCRKLFFARFSHSEYHDEACRLAVESQNPVWKERRRDYMRAVREAEKVH